MQLEEVLRVLQDHHEGIAAYNVKSLSIFGSVARGEAGPSSDVDLLVEFSVPVGFFHFVRLQQYLEGLLGRRVDLTTPEGLRQSMRDQVLKDAVRAA